MLQESRDNGLSKNGDGGSEPRLKQVQLEELEGPLDHNLYPYAKNVAYHVKNTSASVHPRPNTFLTPTGLCLQEAEDDT